jgi:hypothetical protein
LRKTGTSTLVRWDSGVPDIYAHRPLRAGFGVVALVTCDDVRLKTRAEPQGQHLHRLAARPFRPSFATHCPLL